jgi:cytochrome b
MKTKDIIWDIQTRVYHWLIAIPVFLNLVLEDGDKLHKVLGYVALVGLILRIIWGLRTTGHAGLRALPLKWSELSSYVTSLRSKQATPYQGHNPLASWIYIGIWTSVFLLGLSGFMMGLDAFWGEEWLEEVHETLALIIKIQVLLHFVGIVFDSIKFKRKTWLGMIVGKR